MLNISYPVSAHAVKMLLAGAVLNMLDVLRQMLVLNMLCLMCSLKPRGPAHTEFPNMDPRIRTGCALTARSKYGPAQPTGHVEIDFPGAPTFNIPIAFHML